MDKLNKETARDRFISNILKNEGDHIINLNKDLIIKALRLFNDDAFWFFYDAFAEYRKKPATFKEKFIQQQFNGQWQNLPLLEDIEQLNEISKIIQSSSEIEESNKEKYLETLSRFKKYSNDLLEKNKLLDKFIRDDVEISLFQIVKDFCFDYKHDVAAVGQLVQEIVFYNNLPERLKDCCTPISYEEQELNEYKCRLIKLTRENHFAYLKIYKNTKKKNIENFINLKFKEIELYFGEGKLYKRLGIGDFPEDKYKNIEYISESENFKRDLQIYQLSLNKKSDKEIAEMLDLPIAFDFGSIRKIKSIINKEVQRNFLKDLNK